MVGLEYGVKKQISVLLDFVILNWAVRTCFVLTAWVVQVARIIISVSLISVEAT